MKSAVALVCALLIGVCFAQLTARIGDAPATIDGSKSFMLKVHVANSGNTDMMVLPWDTPMEQQEQYMWHPFLEVQHADGSPVEYVGRIARRVAPTPADFEPAVAGAELSVLVDLAANYRFASVGSYRVRVNTAVSVLVAGNNIAVQTLVSEWTPLVVEVSAPPARSVASPLATAVQYKNCDASQQNHSAKAIVQGEADSKNAYNYLNMNKCNSSYVTWFGEYSKSRWNTVQGDFKKIMVTPPGTMYCNPPGCPSNVYAYVYPSDKGHTVYVCGAFFKQDLLGAGATVVHEISHFRDVAGTDDLVYGRSGCKSLAKSNPSQAIRNADNICFFAEDQPVCV